MKSPVGLEMLVMMAQGECWDEMRIMWLMLLTQLSRMEEDVSPESPEAPGSHPSKSESSMK